MEVVTRTRTKLPAGVYEFLVTGRDTHDLREVSALDPSQYGAKLCEFYERRLGKPLDRKKLGSFNESMQWLEFWALSAEKGVLADKYQACPWVAQQIGTEDSAPLLRVWDDPDQIDFDELPYRFMLKETRARRPGRSTSSHCWARGTTRMTLVSTHCPRNSFLKGAHGSGGTSW